MRNGRPFGSHVPYVFGENWTRAYLHLSRLALHTQHLLQDPRVSLFVSESDSPEKNPLALKRMNLQGVAAILSEDQSNYPNVKQHYLDRFPQSSMMFGFGDFDLWELSLDDAHLVLGFGHAYQATASAPSHWIHQRPESKKNGDVQRPSSRD
ncbi:pyridoxamine 5'-phosphate oxidase [Nitrospira sp.]|nr:pyridoxamine 5'-phosphate oxidase [Nitrospira sp.]